MPDNNTISSYCDKCIYKMSHKPNSQKIRCANVKLYPDKDISDCLVTSSWEALCKIYRCKSTENDFK